MKPSLMVCGAACCVVITTSQATVDLIDADQANSSPSTPLAASDPDEISNPALLAPPQQAQLAQQQGPLTLLQVDAQLGELAVFVSGREPQVWWPPMVRGIT